MSLGFGGWCYIVAQDENTVIYQYGSYNLNEPQFRNEARVSDGIITIDKKSFVEPDIHERIKRFPNGKKKLVVKRIEKDVPYGEIYDNGQIQIQNSQNCWKPILDGIDYIAWQLIFRIYLKYQEDGFLPEKVSYFV